MWRWKTRKKLFFFNYVILGALCLAQVSASIFQIFPRIYKKAFNKLIFSRGRLVRWKTLRLQIQRSGFASRLRQTIFLSRVFKRTHIDGTTIYWWQRQKAKAPSLDNSGRYNFHCTKRNVPTNWPYDVDLRVWNDVILLYYAILQQKQFCNLWRHQLRT